MLYWSHLVLYILYSVNDISNGEYKIYHENGQIEVEGIHLDEVMDGKSKEYYKNGNIKFEGQYKDGEMHGKWTKYKKNKKR